MKKGRGRGTGTATPKSIIHQKYGNNACYVIEEIEDETPQNGCPCPGLAILQKPTSLFRCRLTLTLTLPLNTPSPNTSIEVVSEPCKRKKDAQHSAALLALHQLRIDPLQYCLSPNDPAQHLLSRLSFLFSIQFLSSSRPLSCHLKAVSYRLGDLSGVVPVSVLIACDSTLVNLCKSIDARIESNPFLSIPLVKRAAVGLSELLVISEDGLWIRRKSAYPADAMSALSNHQSEVTNGDLTEAVYIPYSLHMDVRSISMNLYSEGYYLDVIAKELGVVDASKVLISRTIGKSSSESRLYFSALEARNLNSNTESLDENQLYGPDNFLNIRASYLLGQYVYGNAILASIGYTWSSVDLFHENVSLRSYFRMLVARTPDGLFKLSRDALLVANLPKKFTSKSSWRGSLPVDVLSAFCRQHRLSAPDFSVVCNNNKSNQDTPGSCEDHSTSLSTIGLESKTEGVLTTVCENSVEMKSFSCEIRIFSKSHNLILESSPLESYMKEGDAKQNASLRVLSFLSSYFKQPNMPLEELSLLSVDCGIKYHSISFLKEFCVCQLMHKFRQPNDFLGSYKQNSRHIDLPKDFVDLENKQFSMQGEPSGSSPSSGSIVSISYNIFLVSEGKEVREILEKSDDFEFEIGTGAVISFIEAAILQMTVGQSVCFYLDLPQKELVLAATMDFEKVPSFLSSSSCCLEYSVSLLRVTEPFEDRMEQALFSPPLSKQRVDFALQCIKELSATSLIDFGCGSGSLLESLMDTPSSLEKIVGVDLSQKGLIRAAKVLNTKLDKLVTMMPTSKVKSAILYDGNITVFDSRLKGFDIGTCLEVIEHMEEDQACLFGDVALGFFQPRVLIVSTPNYEYNVILQKSNLASQEEDPDDKVQPQLCKFRNHDHKFEWTREQFNHWATGLALKHNYSVEFSGVGGVHGVEPGFASQIAVFKQDPHKPLKDFGLIQSEKIYKTAWKWDATPDS